MGNVHGGDERCWLPKPDLDVEAVFDKHLKALSRAKRADKLFLTIAAAFAEAERDRIRERIGQVKADQKARGRYLGGKTPFGFRRGGSGELVPHEAEQEAIREMVALRAHGKPLRAIAKAVATKGHRISHEGVAGVLRAAGAG